MGTVEDRKLKHLGRQTDSVRGTVIDFYIEPPRTPGPRSTSEHRHLIARYEKGGASDLPFVEGRREYATGIPDHWSEKEVLEFCFENPKNSIPPETKQ